MAALLHAAARVAGRQPAAAARRPAGRRPLATAVIRRHDSPSHAARPQPLGSLRPVFENQPGPTPGGLARPARRLATFAERPLGKLVDESLDDDELKRAFDGLADGAAGIPTGDFASTLARAYGFGAGPLSYAMRLRMLWTARGIDENHDGVIEWDEFRRAVRGAEAEALEDAFFSPDALSFLGIAKFDDAALREGFDAVDEDGDGRLCRAELKNLFLRTCPKIGQRGAAFDVMVDNIMDELDADGNDAVSWTEFKSAFAVYYLTYLDRASLMDGSASARHA